MPPKGIPGGAGSVFAEEGAVYIKKAPVACSAKAYGDRAFIGRPKPGGAEKTYSRVDAHMLALYLYLLYLVY